LVWISVLSLLVGLFEVSVPSRLAFVPAAVAKDMSIPVLRRLKELSKQDGTEQGLRTVGRAYTSVFSPNVGVIALLPSWTSQGTLLDISGVYCGTATQQDRKEIFFTHLYYSNVQSEGLRKQLTERDQFAIAMILGNERIFPALTSNYEPIRANEIEREVQAYQIFVDSFTREEAVKRPITYAIIPIAGTFGFTNLDRWYERDLGERVGDYTLYRLKLRD